MLPQKPGKKRFWVIGAKDARNASMRAVGVSSNATGARAEDIEEPAAHDVPEIFRARNPPEVADVFYGFLPLNFARRFVPRASPGTPPFASDDRRRANILILQALKGLGDQEEGVLDLMIERFDVRIEIDDFLNAF